ncbi:hypothetical protein HYH03_000301 [Edaphochlamys debaryana]|uniref:Vacuolar protein sorting-associated protein 35 n=1 Tax=Edaphochlamys debaryana TaxID=47281 RepID=A0A835YIY7_9CHLO|nr:hypothetical protein HYH03_000301 [Edaphochlamys debaryana]|eukprot:KAG2501801.1 hypothetical protein HYH03_000301 [Edaphochlamys debaryana]
MDSIAFPSADEQQRILGEASTAIKRSAFHMRKAIEEDNMRDALKHAAAMLGELRTSQLQPQKYYELYMLAFDQMSHLEAFFADERGKGRSYAELYELVQHAGNVLPRLYLMVAVGCLYIKSREAPPREVLKDLVEMCKGVQHPTRGLFLRAYLCQTARGLLPDTGSEFEGPGSGTIADALDFLMTNFTEMNKLWVRLQHQGSARDKDKRERERQQLQDLVGKNLTYLSQLDGLSFELYRDQVLPRVLDQITSCKDDLAQLYLMQALIQGFPDRFHLGTLEALLGVLPQLQPGVKIHSVMAALMDRLARYAASATGAGADPRVAGELAAIDAFAKFREAIAQVISSQPNLAAADAVEMYTALLSYAGSVHPGVLSYVDEVLAAAHAALGERGAGLGGDGRAERQLVALLSVPLTKYGVDVALALQQYPPLTRLLRYATHKDLAMKIVQRVLDTPSLAISSVPKVAMLFRFIAPLVSDPEREGEPGGAADLDDEDLEEEQLLVARLLHHLRSADPDTHFAILATAQRQLNEGGPRRLRTTLPALVFCGLALHRRLVAPKEAGAKEEGKKVAGKEEKGQKEGGKKEEKKEEGKEEEGEEGEKGEGKEEGKGEGEEGGSAEERAGGEAGSSAEAAPAATASPLAAAPASADEAEAPAGPPKLTSEALLRFLLAALRPLLGGPAGQPLTALRLLLACGQAAAQEARQEMLAYAFFEEAFLLLDDLPDQRTRATALYDIIGGLQRCRVFGPEQRGPLAGSAASAALGLVAPREQARALAAAAWVWWQAEAEKGEGGRGEEGLQPPVRDAKQVVSTLQRAARAAARGKYVFEASRRVRDGAYLGGYVEVVDAAARMWEAEVPGVGAELVQPLLDTVAADLASGVQPDPATARRWAAALGALAAGRERFAGLKLPAAPQQPQPAAA